MHSKTIFRFGGIVVVAATLAACAPNGQPPLTVNQRNAAIGAAGGAVAAKAFDGDPVKGALAGAAVGALCADAAICSPY